MIIRKMTDQFAVIDDFLEPKQFELLWRYFQTAFYLSVDYHGLKGHWRLDDGRVMRTADIYYGENEQDIKRAFKGTLIYPTQLGIDLLIRRVIEQAPKFKDLIGSEGTDWASITAGTRLYERNSSLYWHRDSPISLTGSCTYYGHPTWNIQWGGELYIADEIEKPIPANYGPYINPPVNVMGTQEKVSIPPHLDNKEANKILMESGMGHFVMPKPNRIVILKTGTPHMLTKVNSAAGDHVRASTTLFFKRPGFDLAG